MWRIPIVSTLAAALAVTPAAGAPSKDWRAVQSPHFGAVGTASDKELRSTLQELEAFRYTLSALFPSLSPPPGVPTLVLFKDLGAFRPFAPPDEKGKPRPDVAGYFIRTARGDLFAMGASGSVTTLQTAYHEYIHSIVHRKARAAPTWVDEGLAEFFATFAIDRGSNSATIGDIHEWRRATLKNNPLLPLKDVVDSRRAARLMRRTEDVAMFYAESWAFVHFLVFSKTGSRAGQLTTYLEALAAGQPDDAAFRQAFGGSYDDLDAELRRYVRGPLLIRKVSLEKLAPPAVVEPALTITVAEAEGT